MKDIDSPLAVCNFLISLRTGAPLRPLIYSLVISFSALIQYAELRREGSADGCRHGWSDDVRISEGYCQLGFPKLEWRLFVSASLLSTSYLILVS